MATLKVTDECIGCSACVNNSPELFKMENSKAVPLKDQLSPEEETKAKQTEGICPVDAIKVE